jgi:hypothetical protein
VQLYLPGHRSVVQQLYLQPGKTTNIKRAMEPLAPGEAEPVKPAPEPAIRESQPQKSPNSSASRRQSPYSPSSPSSPPLQCRTTRATSSAAAVPKRAS